MTARVVAGRYELSALIGQGGMGQVWTAYDQRLDRRVAVKLLRPDRVADGSGQNADELRRRFLRECRVTAQVDHPGLVTVHDAGSDEGDLYLVMQHIDGLDLAVHLAEHRPYPWPWAAAVAAQLCAVLASVHAVPIVHRDLKPGNVMVRQDGRVTVLDLGIASALENDAGTTRLTHTGVPIGTPAYMAPEQAMSGAVGPFTDLYALGVLLHELLSGEVPFAGSTPLGVLHRHLYEAPVPLRRQRPEVPEALESLILRLLAKDPQHRPDSAQEVYERLIPLLPGRGAPVTGPLDPTRPFARPLAPWPDRAMTPPPVPAAPVAPPAARTDIAAAIDEVKRLLGEGSLTQAVDILGAILPVAAAEHGEGSPVVRTLRKQYAATLMDDGQFRRALPELRRLADERVAQAGVADPQALRFRYDSAQCLEQLGEPAAALAEYRALLPFYEQRYAENPYAMADPELRLEIRRRIGQVLLTLGDRVAAQDTLVRLLHDAERQQGTGHPFPAEIRRTLQWLGQMRG